MERTIEDLFGTANLTSNGSFLKPPTCKKPQETASKEKENQQRNIPSGNFFSKPFSSESKESTIKSTSAPQSTLPAFVIKAAPVQIKKSPNQICLSDWFLIPVEDDLIAFGWREDVNEVRLISVF
mgnify:CR=1 FL=1